MSVPVDTLLDPIVWRCISNIRITELCLASTTSKDADDATNATGNDGPRIPRGRESTVLLAVRLDGHLHGRQANAALAIFPDERFDTGRVPEGDASGVAVLDDDVTFFTILVKQSWVVQLVFTNVSKLQVAIKRLFERLAGLDVRVNLHYKIEGLNCS
jgi:hypothetical protein